MNNIDQLYTETQSMLSHIQDTSESDELLKQIEDYVAKRSELIQEISLPLSEEEKAGEACPDMGSAYCEGTEKIKAVNRNRTSAGKKKTCDAHDVFKSL